jgi:hypothetical protein
LALAPISVETQSALAIALATRTLDHMTDTPAADLARAKELAERTSSRRPATRLHITSEEQCCARKADGRRPFPNTRRRSRSTAIL